MKKLLFMFCIVAGLMFQPEGLLASETAVSEFVVSGNTLLGYTGKEKDLVIPEFISGKEIKNIDYDVARYYEGAYCVENLTIPKSVNWIEIDFMTPFHNLKNIYVEEDSRSYASVDGILYNKEKTELIYCPAGREGKVADMPEGLKTVGKSAFFSCTHITEAELPDGLQEIKEYAFASCGSMTGIKLPESVTDIGNNAFRYCYSLRDITLPKNVKTLEKSTFRGCLSLTDFEMPETLESFEGDIFEDCSALINISVSKKNTAYESMDGVLYNKAKTELAIYPPGRQETEFRLPEGIIRIGENAFQSCPNLTSVKLPPGLKIIGKQAFAECVNLTELELPEGVSVIEDGAFWSCENLRTLSIPESLTRIGKNAFIRCDRLTKISYPKSRGAWKSKISVEEQGNGVLDSVEIHFGEGTEEKQPDIEKEERVRDISHFENEIYFTQGLWRGILDKKSRTVEIIDYSGRAADMEIPEFLWDRPVTGIGAGTFRELLLESITIPEFIEHIDAGAFDGCETLTEITVSENNPVYASENGILYNKEKTELVICPRGRQGEIKNLPESLKRIGDRAFSECKTLTSIHLPGGLEGIGGYAFFGCSMGSITLPESLKYMNDSAFKMCDNLITVEIPKNVTSIPGAEVFYLCDSLLSVQVAADNPSYASQEGILYNKEKTRLIYCPRMKGGELKNLPKSLTGIEDRAFCGCYNITEVMLPEGIARIGDQAFSGCFNLTEINFPNSLISIGNEAFYGCNLSSVKLPAGLKVLGNYVFLGNHQPDLEIPDGLAIQGNQKRK